MTTKFQSGWANTCNRKSEFSVVGHNKVFFFFLTQSDQDGGCYASHSHLGTQVLSMQWPSPPCLQKTLCPWLVHFYPSERVEDKEIAWQIGRSFQRPGLEIARITSIYPVIYLSSQNSVTWLRLTAEQLRKKGLAGCQEKVNTDMSWFQQSAKDPVKLATKHTHSSGLLLILQHLLMLLLSPPTLLFWCLPNCGN